MTKTVTFLLVVVVALLGVIGFMLFGGPDPCVVVKSAEREINQFKNDNAPPRTSGSVSPRGYTSPSELFSDPREPLNIQPNQQPEPKPIPEDLQRRYDAAYFECVRSLQD